MSHIFISYSRKDLPFAQKIVDALAANDLDTWIDWKSIPKGEDWEQEIYHGIEGSDAFLFLLSPDSVVSEMCNKEIAHAVENGKRILPIVIRDADVENFLFEKAKEEISKRNWIFCRDGKDDFEKAIAEIHETIHTDYEWLKYHTRLQVKALEWERTKDTSRLLRGRELREAEEQIAEFHNETIPTNLQRNYLLNSRRNEDIQRRRLTIGLSLGLIMVAILAVFAWVQRNTAVSEADSRATAQAQAEAETKAKATALVNEEHARATAQAEKERAEQQAKIALSRQLAAQSFNQLNDNNWELAMLLAIEAGKTNDSLEAFSAIRQSLAHQGRTRMIFREIDYAQWSPDGTRLLVIKDGKATIWDVEERAEIITVPNTKASLIPKDYWNKDGSQILTINSGKIEIWNARTGERLRILSPQADNIDDVTWNMDGSRLMVHTYDHVLNVWDMNSGKVLLQISKVEAANWNSKGNRILTFDVGSDNDNKVIRLWNVETQSEIYATSGISTAALNFNNNQILIAFEKGSLEMWSANTGKKMFSLSNNNKVVHTIKWNNIGNRVLTYGSDHIAQVWNAITGERLFSFQVGDPGMPPWPAQDVIWSPDGSHILALGDGTLDIRNTESGDIISQLPSSYSQFGWNSDGTQIFTNKCDLIANKSYCVKSSVLVWDAITGNKLLTLSSDEYLGVGGWNETGTHILTFGDQIARVWDLVEGTELPLFSGSYTLHSIEWKEDGINLLVRDTENNLQLWETKSEADAPTIICQFDGNNNYRWINIKWNKDKTRLLSVTPDDKIKVWDSKTCKELFDISLSQIDSAEWSPDGNLILTIDNQDDNIARIWDAKTGQKLFDISSTDTSFISWGGNGNYILAYNYQSEVAQVWGAKTGKVIYTFPSVNWASWSVDGNRILTEGIDYIIRVWDVHTGKELLVLHDSWESRISTSIWNSDESRILTIEPTRTRARLWDAYTGAELFTITGVTDGIWSKDESRILTKYDAETRTAYSNFLYLWNARTGSKVMDFANPYYSANWDNDGSGIVTIDEDRNVGFWDLITGRERFVITGYNVEMAFWNPEKNLILTYSYEGSIHQWYTHMEDLIRVACKQTPRNLTNAEWNLYVSENIPYHATCPNIPIPEE